MLNINQLNVLTDNEKKIVAMGKSLGRDKLIFDTNRKKTFPR